jgi:hypothetical protein
MELLGRKYDGVAKAEFQIGKLAKPEELRKVVMHHMSYSVAKKNLTKDELEDVFDELTDDWQKMFGTNYKNVTLYESTVDQEYTFKDAKEILDDEEKFEKLNMGEKLNAIRAFGAKCCNDLEIRQLQIYFADFGLKRNLEKDKTYGMQFTGTDVVAVNIKNSLEELKTAIPHEIRHYWQNCVKTGYRRAEVGDKKVDEWHDSMQMPYYVRHDEIDADKFAVETCIRYFTPFPRLVEKHENLRRREGHLENYLRGKEQ